jgi:hypothetical protein
LARTVYTVGTKIQLVTLRRISSTIFENSKLRIFTEG